MSPRDSSEALFRFERHDRPEITLRDLGLFVLRSAMRRRLLAVAVFLGLMTLLAVVWNLKSPEYRVQTTILARRQTALPSIARAYVQEDAPTRDSSELIHRRENLLALVSHAGLLPEGGGRVYRVGLVDRLILAVSRFADPRLASEDPRDQLVRILDRRLKVNVAEGTITIQIDWPNPQQAYRLVEGALQNFLEARHVQEVTTLDETISLLQGRSAALREELVDVTAEARRATASEVRSAAQARVSAAGTSALPPVHSEELVRLRSLLEAKERAVGDVEEFRRRRLAELQAQYDARKAVYAESHPEMQNLREEIAALGRDSPQTTALREEERKLRQEFEAGLARERRPGSQAPTAAGGLARSVDEEVNARVEQNERVRDARMRYNQMLERVSAAEMELATARAAFKYRYAVIWPPELPKKPVGPTAPLIFGLGGLVALACAVIAASAVEWWSGRVVERWQVERELELPVIAELPRK